MYLLQVVTATGWVSSAIVQALIYAGHGVTGLACSTEYHRLNNRVSTDAVLQVLCGGRICEAL